jgi:hypothetical protein
MFRKALAIVGLLLVVFHGWLFAGQVWEGQLADFALASRWLIAAGLAFGLWTLRRQGAPLFRGRRAVALWLLAALLHGPALADRFDVNAPALPVVAAVLVQGSAGIAVLAGFLILLALALRTKRRTPRLPAHLLVRIPVAADPRRSGRTPVFAPRPPPLR